MENNRFSNFDAFIIWLFTTALFNLIYFSTAFFLDAKYQFYLFILIFGSLFGLLIAFETKRGAKKLEKQGYLVRNWKMEISGKMICTQCNKIVRIPNRKEHRNVCKLVDNDRLEQLD